MAFLTCSLHTGGDPESWWWSSPLCVRGSSWAQAGERWSIFENQRESSCSQASHIPQLCPSFHAIPNTQVGQKCPEFRGRVVISVALWAQRIATKKELKRRAIEMFLVGENDSKEWGQQLLRSVCMVALNIWHSQPSLVMRHPSPSLTYSTTKFPHDFSTWRERKQAILHKMNLNTWLRVQGFLQKINTEKSQRKRKGMNIPSNFTLLALSKTKKTPLKYHPHQEQTCLSSVCTYIYICMLHCRFIFFPLTEEEKTSGEPLQIHQRWKSTKLQVQSL